MCGKNVKIYQLIDYDLGALTHIHTQTHARTHPHPHTQVVALKQVKLERAREGFPLTALRELTLLLALRHINVVHVIEVVVSVCVYVYVYVCERARALMRACACVSVSENALVDR